MRGLNYLLSAFVVTLCSTASVSSAVAAGYSEHPEAIKWAEKMKAEGFPAADVDALLNGVKKQQSILNAMDRPAEKRLDWGGYRKLFLEPKRINRGVIFWFEHEASIARAAAEYGVPEEIIVSIIGIETYFGRNMGSYRAMDALATLGFDYPRRAEFFQGQLTNLLTISQQETRPLTRMKSSYAGAMGYGQFMPSSYLDYAIDFDGDGDRDIWGSPDDAIGSVANYFKAFGWQTGGPVVIPVTVSTDISDESLINTGEVPTKTVAQWKELGVSFDSGVLADTSQPAVLLKMKDKDNVQYLLGFNNYYVITRYNRSRLYANAVYRLAEAIAQARADELKGS